MKLIAKSVRISKEAGIALITTLLLLLLMSTLLVGFTLLLISDQQLSGANNDQVKTFYGAEAGMEQLTASLGNLFDQTYSPSKNQISALTTTPPTIAGIQFVRGDGSSGFNIQAAATDSSGNPAPTISTIKSGTYQGMTAMATEYILTVNARTARRKGSGLEAHHADGRDSHVPVRHFFRHGPQFLSRPCFQFWRSHPHERKSLPGFREHVNTL